MLRLALAGRLMLAQVSEPPELRAERDDLRARCGDLGAGPVQATPGALAEAEHRLTQVQAELAGARGDVERLTALLSRKRELVHALQKTKDAQEIELAAANAEVLSRKTGMSGLLSIALAREQAMHGVREAQATRPPVEIDD
ncbi:MAG: hypothetical protein JNL82_37310 [Myxococcales bacterium]|nr:hypothetical protein [Myxococcales bacterium]